MPVGSVSALGEPGTRWGGVPPVPGRPLAALSDRVGGVLEERGGPLPSLFELLLRSRLETPARRRLGAASDTRGLVDHRRLNPVLVALTK